MQTFILSSTGSQAGRDGDGLAALLDEACIDPAQLPAIDALARTDTVMLVAMTTRHTLDDLAKAVMPRLKAQKCDGIISRNGELQLLPHDQDFEQVQAAWEVRMDARDRVPPTYGAMELNVVKKRSRQELLDDQIARMEVDFTSPYGVLDWFETLVDCINGGAKIAGDQIQAIVGYFGRHGYYPDMNLGDFDNPAFEYVRGYIVGQSLANLLAGHSPGGMGGFISRFKERGPFPPAPHGTRFSPGYTTV